VAYTVVLRPAARRELRQLDASVRVRVAYAIDGLVADPRPPGCKKLVGTDQWRIRVGEYRVIYRVQDSVVTVTVTRIGPRGDVYR